MNKSGMSGSFTFGLILGIALMLVFNQPKYQGYTAQEWYNQYQDIESTFNTVHEHYSSQTDCLKSLPETQAYDVRGSYISSNYFRVLDVENCLSL